jgi:hypothetical protein
LLWMSDTMWRKNWVKVPMALSGKASLDEAWTIVHWRGSALPIIYKQEKVLPLRRLPMCLARKF